MQIAITTLDNNAEAGDLPTCRTMRFSRLAPRADLIHGAWSFTGSLLSADRATTRC